MILQHKGYGLILLFLITVDFSLVESASDEELGNVTLRLYLGKTVDDDFRDEFVGDAVSLIEYMDLEKPTVFYIHGFTESLDRDSTRTMIGAYVNRQDHNVVGVSWKDIAANEYFVAASDTKGVGKVLAKVLDSMVKNSLNPETIHVVGHSLGGEIAGFIGRNVNFKLPRITGLDPAGPAFYLINNHLSKKDAKFVDVIHTDAGFYGLALRLGHVDFYPNGGIRIQPGCPLLSFPLSSSDFCSHHRSWRFYAESLANDTAFIGIECGGILQFNIGLCKNNRKVRMGHATSSGTQGTFYLTTNAESPYGRGQDGV